MYVEVVDLARTLDVPEMVGVFVGIFLILWVCSFLGYSPHHKRYKCLDSKGKIFLSHDVIFNESSFPFSVAKAHVSSPPSSVPSQLLPLGVLPIPTAHPNPPSHSIESIESLGSLSQSVELNSP